ncbi:menaquinone biosynthesis protein [Bacillus suaedae]|uniref:Chorismate dehydratase n=1 Tax=Halalkalibacter suaedae TaxID=2822140 RepID=A0A940WY61_9BACI|nr:menaquinone biosynthesis protein [Bacillus suaedae]MBP3950586.1 menaquinone biosynthesis protein [Bacillus suaedae]
MSLRIGEISYTNILPFFYYLDRDELARRNYQFIPQVPAQLNQAMADDRVDIGGISSFAYAKHVDSFTLLPNLSVTTYGAVNSIFLFSKFPINELDGKKVALTSSSETSIHLLKIILDYFYKLTVSYNIVKPNLDEMLKDYDACLLIGDDAITARREQSPALYTYDLGEIWYQQTGLPMTFAVFAVRNETIETLTNEVNYLYNSFLDSKNQSEKDKYQPMISDIIKSQGGPKQFWEMYFHNLCNDFGPEEHKGLLYYFYLNKKLNFLDNDIKEIKVWNPVLQR